MNKDTNRPFSRSEWRAIIRRDNLQKGNKPLTNVEIIDYADEIIRIQNKIPRLAWIQMFRQYVVTPKPKMYVYLIRQHSDIVWPAIIVDGTKAQRVWIDSRGRGHPQQRWAALRQFDIVKAHVWEGKWAGPRGYLRSNVQETVCARIWARRADPCPTLPLPFHHVPWPSALREGHALYLTQFT